MVSKWGLALTLAVLVAACGKRGSPLPPITYIPTATDDLQIQQLGSELLLSMTYPTTTTSGLTLGGLFALHIYELHVPISADEPETKSEESEESEDSGDPEDSEEPEDPDEADGGEEAATQETAPEDQPPTESEPDSEAEEEPPADDQAPGQLPQAGDEESKREPEEAQDDRPRVDRRAFIGAATIRVAIEEAELATLTSGDQIAVRLPIQMQEGVVESLQAFAVRTVSLQQQQSVFSNVVSIVPQPPVAGPSSLRLHAMKEGIEVSWVSDVPENLDSSARGSSSPGSSSPGSSSPGSSSPGSSVLGSSVLGYRVLGYRVLGYNVYRRLAEDRLYSRPVETVGPDERSLVDLTALYGNRYIYTVRMVVGSEPTIESGIASEREIEYRDDFAPEAPRGIELLPEGGRIRVLWTESPDSDVAGYFVYRRDAGGEFRRLADEPAVGTEHVDRGLTSGLSYTYRVTAIDGSDNESPPSEESSANAR